MPHPAPRDPERELEIERKFLLSALPTRALQAPCYLVAQGWLPGDRIQERLRRTRGPEGEEYVRAIKAGTGVVRLEIEERIPRSLFRALWPMTKGCRIRKRRYLIQEGGLEWEIDAFLDFDMVVAEVELPSESTPVVLPDWLEPLVTEEVTGHAEYLNINLARNGPPRQAM
jgi:adenylate cyclase